MRESGPDLRSDRSLAPLLPYVVVVGLFVLSAAVVEFALGYSDLLDLHFYSPKILAGLALYFPFLVLYHATYTTFVEKQSVLSKQTWRSFRKRHLSPRRALSAVLLLGLLGPLMSTFVSYKAAIPHINPFSWDPSFLALDYWLHGGAHPWKLLFPWFGSPTVISFLDSVYVMWFPALVMTVVWLAWSGPGPLRSQFFLAYALTWIVLGVGVAIALSSAGPCYYTEVVGAPNPYVDLLSHLATVDQTRPLAALDVQSILWTDYTGLAEDGIEGISAMPSLHVAMATLMALLYFRVHYLAGLASTAFGVLIFLGSIMLGWHYAVDGYLAAVLVVPLWWISGRVQAAIAA